MTSSNRGLVDRDDVTKTQALPAQTKKTIDK